MSFSVVTGYETTLSAPMTSSQLTVAVNSIRTQDATPHTLTTADIGSNGWYLTIAPGTASEEVVKVTAITPGSGSGGTFTVDAAGRGLAFYGTTDAVGTGNAKAHNPGDIVILSNAKNVYDRLVDKESDETIAGVKTFSSSPLVPTPTSGEIHAAASIEYVNGVVVGAGVDATTTIKGISKLSAAPVSPTSPIAVGDNDTRVPTQAENDALVGNNTDIAVGSGNKFVTQTGLQKSVESYAVAAGTDTYTATLSPVPTSYATGMTVRLAFTNANTTVATLNLNGLGAKDIRKNGGTTLNVGDIVAGGVLSLTYQGTYFEIAAPFPVSNASGAILSGGTTSLADSQHTHVQLGAGQQDIPFVVSASTAYGSGLMGVCTSTDGATMITAHSLMTSVFVVRYAKDASSGIYFPTHTASITGQTSATAAGPGATVIIGSYVYIAFYDNGATNRLYRLDLADLANQTSITYSGTVPATVYSGFTNGTDLYLLYGSDNVYRYTISGTTATNAGSISYTSAGFSKGMCSDGVSVWSTTGSTGTITIKKYAIAGGATTATDITKIVYPDAYSNNSDPRLSFRKTSVLQLMFSHTTVKGSAIMLLPLAAN